jgi:tripartite-type tricarboxylate transporter receptor subunit TctC
MARRGCVDWAGSFNATEDLVNRLAFAASVALLLLAGAAAAQDAPWPSKPLRLVVPGGTGGVTDIRARWLAERLGPALGQSVVVENRAGAGGNIAMESVARSAPDGYTLIVIHQGIMTINPHLYPKLGYDALKDFAPVTRVGIGSLLLVVNTDVPAKTVSELIALAKASPGKLSFGSPGVGTPPHLAAELFRRMAGIDTIHVAFKGGGQAVTDLIGGHVNYSIEGLTVTLPQVKAGRLRAIAVTGPVRVASLPDVPTIAESGLPGYEYLGWVGIAAPAGTPRPIVERLHREIAAILNTPEGRAWLNEAGAEPGTDAPDVFAAAIRAEHAKWADIIRMAGIKAE